VSTQDSQDAPSGLGDLIASMTVRVDAQMPEIEDGRKRIAKDIRALGHAELTEPAAC
jgi:hypothetical protein